MFRVLVQRWTIHHVRGLRSIDARVCPRQCPETEKKRQLRLASNLHYMQKTISKC